MERLNEFPPETVETVCLDLGDIAPDEYQPKFPPLHVIREHCWRHEQARRDRILALHAPKVIDPVAPEKLTQFKADVEAAIERMRMR